jgi:hypothetical protein
VRSASPTVQCAVCSTARVDQLGRERRRQEYADGRASGRAHGRRGRRGHQWRTPERRCRDRQRRHARHRHRHRAGRARSPACCARSVATSRGGGPNSVVSRCTLLRWLRLAQCAYIPGRLDPSSQQSWGSRRGCATDDTLSGSSRRATAFRAHRRRSCARAVRALGRIRAAAARNRRRARELSRFGNRPTARLQRRRSGSRWGIR